MTTAADLGLATRAEIELEGSNRSLDRTDLPDFEAGMEAIFEEGLGGDLASVKRRKFRIPPSYGKRASNQPMEIILESAEARQSERNGHCQ